jgi:hypothetical protein
MISKSIKDMVQFPNSRESFKLKIRLLYTIFYPHIRYNYQNVYTAT